MDNPNAFIGEIVKPTTDELAIALEPTSALLDQLVEILMTEPGVTAME